MKLAAVIGFVLALWCGCGLAAEVRLAWDGSSSAGITNYVVRANGTNRTNVGTNLTAVLSLPAGEFSVTVTAQNQQGIESDPSNALQVSVPRAPVIRLNLQTAGSPAGPWTNVAALEAPLPQALQAGAFFRAELGIK